MNKMELIHMASMHEMTMDIMRYSNLEDMIKTIVDKACQLYKASGGFCFLINEDKTEIESMCSIGIDISSNPVISNPAEGITGQVCRSGKELFVEDYSTWEGRIPAACCDNMHATLGYPLKRVSGEVIGVIGVTHFEKSDRFLEEDIKYMRDFAYLASILLDNARLYEKLQKELNEKEKIDKILRQNEEQIRQTQKMEALGTLAGGIAHDFNNILTGIVGYTELAIEEAQKDSIMYQCLLEVLKLGARAKDLVSQILVFSRKKINKNQRLDIEKVLIETVRMLRATLPTTITIKVNYKYSPAIIYADPTEIQQLVMNLCINSEHAMKEQGGTIDITLDKADNVPESYIRLNSLKSDSYLRLAIKDTGCGMDKRTMDRIFEPFFTTKGIQGGTGLGLSIVHGIVTRHEGFITVDSELGKGSTFNIYLPFADDTFS